MQTDKVNGEMVRLAREKRAMTQTELAEAAGLPQAAVSRIESGEKDDVTFEQIRGLSEALGFPATFFHLPELYRDPISVHAIAYRKKAAVSAKTLRAVVASGNHYVIQLHLLADSVDIDPQFELLQFELVNDKDMAGQTARSVVSPAEAARLVRASWQLHDEPLLQLTSFIEASGVTVIHADFGNADVDGFTVRPIKSRPVIVLNKNRPADRMRFSLAHEYGHVVLHAFPDEAMEKQANEFAAALLMPEVGISADFRSRRLTLPVLGQLKLKWRVAISALIYRARELGVITAYEAKKLWIDMSNYRLAEPPEYDVPHEQPTILSDLIKAHRDELGYSNSDLASAVRTKLDEFALMHGLNEPQREPKKPKLRLVINRTEKSA